MREKVKKIVESGAFTGIIFALILLNTITLGIETFTLSAAATSILSTINTVCIVIFVLEILLKLYAYGPAFFKDAWNIFDVVIVVISILPMIKFLSSMRAFRIFRLFRALRALRMMKRLEKLRIIVQALLGALPSVAWVVVLLLIIYYIFGVIGTNLFATVSPEYFGSLWRTFYTLFQVTMADDLGNISRPLWEAGVSAPIYFISFVVLSSVLVLNVIVGVVVDSVAEIKKHTDEEEHNKIAVVSVSGKNDEEAAQDISDEQILAEIESLEQQLDRMKSVIASRVKK